MSLDVAALRAQFPILSKTVDGKPLVYLDNAATTQNLSRYRRLSRFLHGDECKRTAVRTIYRMKPRAVTKMHVPALQSSLTRKREEVIWTSGTTEAINIVANGLGQLLSEGDEDGDRA